MGTFKLSQKPNQLSNVEKVEVTKNLIILLKKPKSTIERRKGTGHKKLDHSFVKKKQSPQSNVEKVEVMKNLIIVLLKNQTSLSTTKSKCKK